MKKKVITIDLNPLSRTAQSANISIIDNIVRAMPYLVETTKKIKNMKRSSLEKIVEEYDNQYNLDKSIKLIRGNAGSKFR
jgi:4-phosphopantoate--beta-alanine ligase